MAEGLYVGAHRGPRAEWDEQCVARLSGQLSVLSDVDPRLASWFRSGRSREASPAHRVDPLACELQALLLAGRQRPICEVSRWA